MEGAAVFGAPAEGEAAGVFDVLLSPPLVATTTTITTAATNAAPTSNQIRVIRAAIGATSGASIPRVGGGGPYFAACRRAPEVPLPERQETLMIASDTSVHYTVERGDWLAKIGRSYGESWQQLYKDNRQAVGSDPNLIYPGTVLAVHPGGSHVTVHTSSAVSSTAESVSLPQTTAGAIAVAYARTKIGYPYRWGATGPNAFDCSGLVYAAWRKAGVRLPRTANEMWQGLRRVSLGSLRVGDIIAFGYSSSYADHVGLYAGHGLLIDTSSHRPGGGVGIQSLKSRTGGGAWHVLGAVRPKTGSSSTKKASVKSSMSLVAEVSTSGTAHLSMKSIGSLISQIFQGQAACAANIVKRESGFSVTAYNPSGAYGLPQALPGSKMASAGADWRTNPATQLSWMLSYVNARYGGACNAWSYWEAHSAY